MSEQWRRGSLTLIASSATSREFGLVIPGSTSLRNSCLLSWSSSNGEFVGRDGWEPEAVVADAGGKFREAIAVSIISRSPMGKRKRG